MIFAGSSNTGLLSENNLRTIFFLSEIDLLYLKAAPLLLMFNSSMG